MGIIRCYQCVAYEPRPNKKEGFCVLNEPHSQYGFPEVSGQNRCMKYDRNHIVRCETCKHWEYRESVEVPDSGWCSLKEERMWLGKSCIDWGR